MSDPLTALSTYLSQSLQPATRRAAEQALAQAETQPGFLLLVLQLVGAGQAPPEVRLGAGVLFKNAVKRGWAPEDAESNFTAADRAAVKAQIVPAMIALSSRPPLQLQIGEAVSLIAEHDFPQQWEGLIDQLVSSLSETDYSINNGVLTTAHSIFRRWRAQFKSDALYSEINYVLSRFCEPYLALFQRTDALLSSPTYPTLPAQQRDQLAHSMVLLLQLFYDLNAQDLPPFFEDNTEVFMGFLAKYLVDWGNNVDWGANEDDADPTPLEKIRASICESVELYAQRYLDAFPQLGAFVERVWTLLTHLGPGQRFDLLVAKAMRFLSSVVRNPGQRALFENEQTLEQFCEKIVLPNMALRTHEEEMFEDDPLEYVRRDLEPTTESDTRRSAATEFTRALMEQFEASVTGIIQRYITLYLQQYNADPANNWKSKNTAIYLLTSIASRGATTQHGVTSTNVLVDVISFFSTNVFSDLQAALGTVHPILEVDAIKFLHTFRNQLSKDQILSVLPLLVRHLASDNYVVYSYAAITIERVLFIRQNGQPLFTSADVRPFAQDILLAIFAKISSAPTPEKKAENDYLARAAMRVILTSKGALAPVYLPVLEQLSAIVAEISKNPSNPRFSQYLFESISALVKYVVADDPASLPQFEQKLLYGPFQTILAEDITEFTPYVFQIVAQLLELHSSASLPDSYQALLPPLLTPTLWEQRGNVPALVRLLRAFLVRASPAIVANNQLPAVLGVFQKLVASRLLDIWGFELLQALFENVPVSAFDQYTTPVLTLLLTRLQGSKTDQFTRAFIYFVFFVMAVQREGLSADYIVGAFEKIQPGLFSQLLTGVILREIQKVPQKDRKVVSVGLIRLLASNSLQSEPLVKAWPATLEALLRVLLLPQDLKAAGKGDDDLYVDEDTGYQASFSKLASSEVARQDPVADVADPRALLSAELARISVQKPGMLPPLISQVPQELTQPFLSYMQTNSHTIA